MLLLCSELCDLFDLFQTQLETHWWLLSIVDSDALMLKHQAISTHSAEWFFISRNNFHA